jgi:hypothetical protein
MLAEDVYERQNHHRSRDHKQPPTHPPLPLTAPQIAMPTNLDPVRRLGHQRSLPHFDAQSHFPKQGRRHRPSHALQRPSLANAIDRSLPYLDFLVRLAALVDESAGDIAELQVGVLGEAREALEGLLVGDAMVGHEDAFGLLDDGAGAHRLGHVPRQRRRGFVGIHALQRRRKLLGIGCGEGRSWIRRAALSLRRG